MLIFLSDLVFCSPLGGLLILSIIYYAINYFRNDGYNYPPGPTGIPFIGYLPYLGNQPHLMLEKVSKKYGGIFTIRIAGRRRVVLSSYEAIKAAYITDANNYMERPEEFTVFSSLFGFRALNFKNGDEWKFNRKVITSSLRLLTLGGIGGGDRKSILECHISDATRKLVQDIRNLNSYPADLYSVFAEFTMGVVECLIFGEALASTRPEIAQTILQDIRSSFSKVPPGDGIVFRPIANVFSDRFTREQKEIKKILERQLELMDPFIQEHLTTFDPSNIRDCIDMYLNEKFKFEKTNPGVQWFSFQNMAANLFMLIMGATDTVATILYFAIFLMAKHPDIQTKCQGELDDLISRGEIPDSMQKQQLPYVDAVINEVIRYSAIIPMPTSRRTTSDTELLGYRVPANTHFSINVWAVTRDPSLWMSPNEFNPDNFYEKDVPRDLASLSFSAGRRQCPGENLSRMELYLLFTSILQEFTISIPPGKNLEEEIQPEFSRVLSPFKIIATPR